VLASYGYIDKEMNLLFKGKVALDIQSTDKILTTELIFSGLLKDMPLPEVISLFSVLYEKIRPGRGAEPCSAQVSD
jgi:superfamily II RNA helicase